MIIQELHNGFRIVFDEKLSIVISKEEALVILEYLKAKEQQKAFENKKLSFFDCGEY